MVGSKSALARKAPAVNLPRTTTGSGEGGSWLVAAILEDPEWAGTALIAMAGSRGWFEKMRPRLPALMIGPPSQAGLLVPLLYRATAIARAAVLTLVEEHWMQGDGYRASRGGCCRT